MAKRESAGKRKSGHTNHGNRWLRTALVQSAWAASHSKKTYLAAQYRRLVGRRSKKRAIVAVGQPTINAIVKGARSGEGGKGQVGDGKIFIISLENTVRISDGVQGGDAI